MRRILGLAVFAVVAATCSGGEIAVTTTGAIDQPATSTTTTSTEPPGTTLGGNDPSPFKLLVLGDWGSGTVPQGAVAGAMARFAEDNPIEAILTTGDNFYSDDADFLLQPFDWW